MEPKDRLPTNDRFSDIITDAERDVILKAPTPMIVSAMGDTLHDLGKEVSGDFLKKIFPLATTGEKIDEVVEKFRQYVQGDAQKNLEKQLAPFVNGSSSGYLAIICGFIEGARELNQKNPDLVDKTAQSFREKASTLLISTSVSDESQGRWAINTITENFREPRVF